MAKSGALRAGDVLAITGLVGQCRELGDDRLAWGTHFLAGLSDLVDGEGGHTGEMAGCDRLELADLGVVRWLRAGLPAPSVLDAEVEAFVRDPNNWRSQHAYHRANRADPGACLARTDFIGDRSWGPMPDHAYIREVFGLDHRMWCFRALPLAGPDEHVGAIIFRAAGRRDYARRDRAAVALALELIAPLVGGPLARFTEPSPSGLTPRAREVLACLLEGDSDKQVAARLGMSAGTVNTHTRTIFRHFGVRGRVELMARWIRRGWGGGRPWANL